MDTTATSPREFHYYNSEGVFIGKSAGDTPETELFNVAHYVFDNQNEILKNMDVLSGMKKRLIQLRRKLIQTSVRDVEQLMALNRDIHLLEQNIERLENGLPKSDTLAALKD